MDLHVTGLGRMNKKQRRGSLGSGRLHDPQDELTDLHVRESGYNWGFQCADGCAAFADVLLRVPRPITMAMSLG
jgi:hypothetical protein